MKHHAASGAPMRLLILNQFFHPDHSATSQLMTALAEDLTQHGVQVTALASRGSYNGGAAFPLHETYRGIEIKRVWATSLGKKTPLHRLSDYFTFYLGALWALLTMPRQDVVMALTTPPLIGLIGLLVARLRGMRFVSLLEDLYPDVGVAVGVFPAHSWIVRPLAWLSQVVMRQADRLIVLSDCMFEQVVTRLGAGFAGRIDVIHNWADGAEIKPMPQAKQTFFSQRQLPEVADKFVVLFSGNFGLVNDFSTVFTAAKELQCDQAEADKFAFVFIGAGAREQELRARIVQQGLSNVYLLPYEPREQMPYALAASDVLLITLKNGLAGLSMPSKTYSSLAAGRPLLYIGDQRSSLASLIEESKCGVTLANGQSAQLIEVLRGWLRNQQALAIQGQRARSLFERRFHRALAVQAYLECLQRCVYGKVAMSFGPAYSKQAPAPQLAHLSAQHTLNVSAVSLAAPPKIGERLNGPSA